MCGLSLCYETGGATICVDWYMNENPKAHSAITQYPNADVKLANISTIAVFGSECQDS
jgi:hypothetical protein